MSTHKAGSRWPLYAIDSPTILGWPTQQPEPTTTDSDPRHPQRIFQRMYSEQLSSGIGPSVFPITIDQECATLLSCLGFTTLPSKDFYTIIGQGVVQIEELLYHFMPFVSPEDREQFRHMRTQDIAADLDILRKFLRSVYHQSMVAFFSHFPSIAQELRIPASPTTSTELTASFIESLLSSSEIVRKCDSLTIDGAAGVPIALIPPQIEKLSALRELHLSCPNVRTIPNSLWSLASLVNLNLALDSIESLPSQIGRLQELRTLNVSGRRLKELPPGLANLTHCERMDFVASNLIHLPNVTLPSSLTGFSLKSDKLRSIPDQFFPSTSSKLRPELDCPQLERLPDCCYARGVAVISPSEDAACDSNPRTQRYVRRVVSSPETSRLPRISLVMPSKEALQRMEWLEQVSGKGMK